MSYSRHQPPKKKSNRAGPVYKKLGYSSENELYNKYHVELKKPGANNKIIITNGAVYCEYDENLNIHKLHKIVIDKLSNIDNIVITKLKEMKSMYEKQFNECINFNDALIYAEHIEECVSKLEKIESNEMLSGYKRMIHDIITEFDEAVVKGDKKEVSDIVDSFVRIAMMYVSDLTMSKKRSYKGNNCNICSSSLNGIEEENGCVVCEICGKIHPKIIQYYKNEDTFSFEKKARHTENEKNFHKAIINFDLRADYSSMPSKKDIIKRLDEYFFNYDPPMHRDRVKNSSYDRWIKVGTSISVMEQAMKQTKYNNYYDQICYFCHVYWDWKCPNIVHLEEKLMQDFRDSRESYNLRKGTRNSSMNINYELYYGLLRNGFKCKFDDFKMIKTPNTIIEYDRIRRQVEADMGWPLQ